MGPPSPRKSAVDFVSPRIFLADSAADFLGLSRIRGGQGPPLCAKFLLFYCTQNLNITYTESTTLNILNHHIFNFLLHATSQYLKFTESTTLSTIKETQFTFLLTSHFPVVCHVVFVTYHEIV